jgi:hypothetical protein
MAPGTVARAALALGATETGRVAPPRPLVELVVGAAEPAAAAAVPPELLGAAAGLSGVVAVPRELLGAAAGLSGVVAVPRELLGAAALLSGVVAVPRELLGAAAVPFELAGAGDEPFELVETDAEPAEELVPAEGPAWVPGRAEAVPEPVEPETEARPLTGSPTPEVPAVEVPVVEEPAAEDPAAAELVAEGSAAGELTGADAETRPADALLGEPGRLASALGAGAQRAPGAGGGGSSYP